MGVLFVNSTDVSSCETADYTKSFKVAPLTAEEMLK